MNKQATDHFKYTEFICPCCDRLKLTDRFFNHVSLIEKIRTEYGKPIKINSAYRCPVHNHAVGGVEHSQHLEFATDIAPAWVGDQDDEGYLDDLNWMYGAVVAAGFTGIGRYNTFIHCDLRDIPSSWDNRTI